ncbi:MAG: crotonase/enoyl-CoA hydratase family protein [Saprospiraceae bacterium]|nr:crotonase/enoyl-CoA hydratase family protein [Saprospiraceae bacterium]
MDCTNFTLDVNDHIAHLSFNRPQKSNSLHLEAWLEMKDIFEHLDNREDVRVIILSGHGKHFCAGIDLALLMDMNKHESISCEGRKRIQVRDFIKKLQDCISAIEICRKPVIAAIHKACIGGGVDIISACDMRYCTDDAYFSIKEIDMGLVADIGTLQRLPKILNPGIMAEIAFTGRTIFGSEANSIGMVNKCLETKEAMMSEVIQIAEVIASKSPLVVKGIKENLQYTRDHTVHDSLNYIGTYNAAFMLSNDLKESFIAQMEKRKAVYEN